MPFLSYSPVQVPCHVMILIKSNQRRRRKRKYSVHKVNVRALLHPHTKKNNGIKSPKETSNRESSAAHFVRSGWSHWAHGLSLPLMSVLIIKTKRKPPLPRFTFIPQLTQSCIFPSLMLWLSLPLPLLPLLVLDA